MAEQVVLDPSEIASGRTQIDISAWIRADAGVDWGDAAIAAFMADQQRGSTPIDYRVPNRTVQIPLSVRQIAGSPVGFEQARQQLQQKVARFQQEGGWLKRVTSAGHVFADVVNASLHLSGSWMQWHKGIDIEATMELECLPDFYGDEITLPDHVNSGTATGFLSFTETGVKGDYPGRVRIVVDNDSASDKLSLIWGVRSKNYSAANTALLGYQTASLTNITPSRGTVVGSNWTAMYSTDAPGLGGALTHVGTYRVFARVAFQDATLNPGYLRLVWDVGDLALPVENVPWTVPPSAALSNQFIADLGEIRLDRVPVGAHRWQGVIQGHGTNGGELMDVDQVWFVPVDDGFGVLRANMSSSVGVTGYTAQDSFNQTAGQTLTGKVAGTGGTW